MKRCPTCNRTFDDDTLMVCLDDGSALVDARESTTTQAYGALGGKATWSPSQDQIAEIQQYVAATTTAPRRIWPWIVVTVVVLFILIGFVVIIVRRL